MKKDIFNIPDPYDSMDEKSLYYDIDEQLDRLSHYYADINRMISNNTDQEIRKLEDSNKDVFPPGWTKNDYIRSIHYLIDREYCFFENSFIIILFSLFERNIARVCKKIKQQHGIPISSAQLKGSPVDRSKLYLEAFGKFKKPESNNWKKIKEIYTVRNICAHNNFRLENIKNNKEDAKNLNNLLKKNCGISDELGDIYIDVRFAEYCIGAIKEFFHKLKNEHLKRLHGKVVVEK